MTGFVLLVFIVAALVVGVNYLYETHPARPELDEL